MKISELHSLLSAARGPALLLTFYSSRAGYFDCIADSLEGPGSWRVMAYGSSVAFEE